jgi:hypothetical protein
MARKLINCGVFGYGVDQTLLRTKGLLSRYQVSTVIFSFIADDIGRCQTSQRDNANKPYFEMKDGQLALENVPVPRAPFLKESKLINALEHSLLVHTVMMRLSPDWWLGPLEIKVQDENSGR